MGQKLIVLGAGPVGLLAALRGRQIGIEVDVYTERPPRFDTLPRIEVIPAQMVALLVEFGVHPKALGVSRLFERRHTQWGRPAASQSMGPPVAHVARPALELALLELALRAGVRIEVGAHAEAFLHEAVFDEAGMRVVDASGRAALSAATRIRPAVPIIARTLYSPAVSRHCDPEFSIAAGPAGYAYRLGGDFGLCLGVVGRGDMLGGPAAEVVRRVADFAPWLVADVSLSDVGASGAGSASVQWSIGRPAITRMGDAAFASDALSSQGLALGLSEGIRVTSQLYAGDRPKAASAIRNAHKGHLQKIADLIETSPFASQPEWFDYREFLTTNVAPQEQRAHT